MDDASSQRLGVALALVAACLWGVSGAVAADSFGDVPPARVAQARAALAALLLVPYAWWRGAFRVGGGFAWLAVLGINLAAVNVTFYWAIDRLGVGPGATVQFLAPVLVLGWMAAVQGRVVRTGAWVAAVVSVGGVALVSRAWDEANVDWLGVAAGLASAVFFASYLMIGEHLGTRLRPITIMAWGFLIASAFWAVAQPPWDFPRGIAGEVWLKLLWVGVAGTALPFLIEFAALRRAAAGLIGVVATTEPVIGATAAWIMLGQRLGAVQIVGGIMVVAAVASIQRRGLPEVPYDAAR